LDEEDLKALRDALVVSLSMLPPYALVGLIAFGTMVSFHINPESPRSHSNPHTGPSTRTRLFFYPECSKSYVFRGSKEYSQKQVQDMLGLSPQNRAAPRTGQPGPPQNFGAAPLLLPVSQVEFQLTTILEQLARDPWPVANDKRALRCTGNAVGVAVSLLESTFPATGARVMLFSGGSCTEGPGLVVGNELRELIRSHNDIERDTVKHFEMATKVRREQFLGDRGLFI
jgi:protein transport protein SEC23